MIKEQANARGVDDVLEGTKDRALQQNIWSGNSPRPSGGVYAHGGKSLSTPENYKTAQM